MKKLPVNITDMENSHNLLLSWKDIKSANFIPRNEGSLRLFKIWTETRLCWTILYNRKIIGISCLLIHVKWVINIYFIEYQIFKKQLFFNYGTLKMVFHVFAFLCFLCFRGTFFKNFMKKLPLFNTNFWNSIQDLVLC